MIKNSIILVFVMLFSINRSIAQDSRVKLDGVAAVVGKNIVLDSEIAAYKLELEQQSEGKVDISDCEMLEQIMERKLLSHHAVIDSVAVTEPEINTRVEQKIAYFLEQLGSEEKLYNFYGFNDMADLRKEFVEVERELLLVQRMQAKLTEEVDVTPEEVRNYYQSLEKTGDVPEIGAEIELAQIVMYAEPSKAEKDRIIAELNKFKEQIQRGESFKMKAILYSDDPAASSQGQGQGGLYTITRDSRFITEFKEVAFGLEEGEISDPFESSFGFHIIQVEKIRGKQRDVRHILLQPEVTDERLEQVKDSLINIRKDILAQKLTFKEAVQQYSEEKATKATDGFLINPQTNDTKFEMTKMDPELYGRVSTLDAGEITDVFFDVNREGQRMYKIIWMKSKTPAHKADLVKDYVKIQNLALQKKREETISKWIKSVLGDTYININDDYQNCDFKYNWKKIAN